MSIKTKIILISIILVLFIITLGIIIFIKTRPKELEESVTESTEYAINPTFTTEETSEEVTTEEEYSKYADNPVFKDIKLYSDEQNAQKNDFISMIKTYDKHKTINKVELDDTQSTDEIIYATLYYDDNSDEDVVIGYDKYTEHKFLFCVSSEAWEKTNHMDVDTPE